MTIKKSVKHKSETMKFLEKIMGGPLTFGGVINAIRLGEELSQVEFAKFLKISKAHLCDIEKGRRFVSPSRAWKWGSKLGYSPEQFVQLVIEGSLKKEGLHYRVTLEAA